MASFLILILDRMDRLQFQGGNLLHLKIVALIFAVLPVVGGHEVMGCLGWRDAGIRTTLHVLAECARGRMPKTGQKAPVRCGAGRQ